MFTDTVTRVGSGRPNDMNPVLQKIRADVRKSAIYQTDGGGGTLALPRLPQAAEAKLKEIN